MTRIKEAGENRVMKGQTDLSLCEGCGVTNKAKFDLKVHQSMNSNDS